MILPCFLFPAKPDASPVPAVPPRPCKMSSAPSMKGFHPPVFKGPFPVRSVSQRIRDAVLKYHSMRCMVLTTIFKPLDSSAQAKEGHSVIDFNLMTCTVLEDKTSFEEVRCEFYYNQRASKTSLHVFSIMPDLPFVLIYPPYPKRLRQSFPLSSNP